jgi:hypothetical protein
MERGQLDFLHSPQAEERNICFPTHSTNHRKEHQLTCKLQQLSNKLSYIATINGGGKSAFLLSNNS